MTHDDFARYHAVWEGRIRALARRLAGRDRDLAQDLEQVGRCALWQVDLACLTGDERRYLWRILRNAMVSEVRRERRRRIVVPCWRRDRRLVQRPAGSGACRPRRRELHRRGAPRHAGAAPDRIGARVAA